MVRPVPVTIGSCLILLKRKCTSLSEVTKEEMNEFPDVCHFFEKACTSLYGAVKFNYHANMMKENFVHFKAIPRYDKEVTSHGMNWIDEDYPSTEHLTKHPVEEEILQAIKQDFLSFLKNKEERGRKSNGYCRKN